MSWVYRRTGTAMAITSATTCAAFLCTLITPLSSIQSFGIFAACVILIDYVLVMSLFCTAVVIYHDRYENRARCGCCCPCGVQNPSVTENAKAALEANDGEFMKRDRVSEFFRVKVLSFVQKPLNRLVLAVIFLCGSAFRFGRQQRLSQRRKMNNSSARKILSKRVLPFLIESFRL